MERTLLDRRAAPRPALTLGSWLLRLAGLLHLWAQRARTRRQLAQLDERLLADAGISACERAAELNKPFWR
ncbi:DUF1127 domain-containing protein [Pseudomonas sp. UL073]|uniref:DUF1127 domain-containing protein n=1 Tax=Zestomonas insulae TaxID=2809017 RepID=A0ABS2IHK5_9GAMM|nr:DUF1127 domain-containing protein [Pseudomonas insulae]MBM7062544.1 DUF1127 domain-containing protein [Pseudomonas insulae]